MTDTRYVPSPDAIESRVGDETVLLHLGNATYYGLDPVGTRIWELIKQGHDTAAIRAVLMAEYGQTEDVIAADVVRFLADLLAQQIIVAA